MIQNRFQRENEVNDAIIRFFRDGKFRSTGDELIEISVDFNSVSISLRMERFQQLVQEAVSSTSTPVEQDNRMQ